jgi:IS5 family transposase
MGRLRKLAKKCKELGKEYADDPDAPAVAHSGDGGHADWVRVGLIIFQEEINKPLRKYEDYLNEMPGILAVFNLEESPDHTSFSDWDKEFSTRWLRRLLRGTAEQAGVSGQAAIDASGFQRSQTSSHYRKRADYSFGVMKTTLLVDTESLAIRDAHFTTRKSYDGHIGLQVFRRNAEDLRELLADKMYSWQELREACRGRSTRPVIKHKELSALKKAHNARIDDEVYNQRSMSETVFAMMKTDNKESLRARSWHGQFRELTRKCILHNLSLAVGG